MHQNPFNPCPCISKSSNCKNLIQEIFCTRESTPFVSNLISESRQFCLTPLALLLHVFPMHVCAMCGKHAGFEDARQRQWWQGGFKYRREPQACVYGWYYIVNHSACNPATSCMGELNSHKIRLWLQLIRKMNENIMSLGWSLHASTEGLTSKNLAVLQRVQSIYFQRSSRRRFSFMELEAATGGFSAGMFHNHQAE